MVYFSKKQATSGTATITGNNNFRGINTFNEDTNFNNTINFKNPSNNNGAFLDNFDYNQNNLTALKFTKNPTKALLILEVDNTRETATISSPTTNNNLSIQNLKNPNAANDAANKQYVDSKVVFIDKTNISFTRQEINTTAGQQVTKYYTNSISYNNIATGCTGIISIACSDIPVNGEHLVITYFPKRGGNNALIEIYQYNSSNNITTQLQQAHFQFVIQKSV